MAAFKVDLNATVCGVGGSVAATFGRTVGGTSSDTAAASEGGSVGTTRRASRPLGPTHGFRKHTLRGRIGGSAAVGGAQ